MNAYERDLKLGNHNENVIENVTSPFCNHLSVIRIFQVI